MKMPVKMKAKWLKALRSGEYKQAAGKLYNPATCGFCCLGVLQHTVCSGKVEVYDDLPGTDTEYLDAPSYEWYEDNGIIETSDSAIDHLIDMNDGKLDYNNLMKNGEYKAKGRKKFATIADWIEKNIETY